MKSCSSCGYEDLEPGFLAENQSPGYGCWVPGALEFGPLGGAKLFGKERWEVRAYRCKQCSHLDLFAAEPGGY
jgi:hypothetical protein